MGRKLPVRVVALDDWPASDRHAWSRARATGNVLDEQGGLSKIADVWLPQFVRAYGRWLGYLADYEGLQSIGSGVDYLSRECLSGFLHLLEAHLAPCTTRNYMTSLRSVARALRPDADLSDLDAATRRLWRDAQPIRDKRSQIVPSRDLWKLGLDLMDTCFECTTRPKRLGQYRDGLMIALLASRPIRRKNLAQIEIGQHLQRTGDVYWLFFDAHDMKNRRSLEFPLPRQLTLRFAALHGRRPSRAQGAARALEDRRRSPALGRRRRFRNEGRPDQHPDLPAHRRAVRPSHKPAPVQGCCRDLYRRVGSETCGDDSGNTGPCLSRHIRSPLQPCWQSRGGATPAGRSRRPARNAWKVTP